MMTYEEKQLRNLRYLVAQMLDFMEDDITVDIDFKERQELFDYLKQFHKNLKKHQGINKINLEAYGIDFPIDDILKKDIETFITAKQSGKELLDCEAAEIDGDIRAGLNAGTLTKEQADFLYELFVHSW